MPPPALTVHNAKYCRKRGERPAGILDNLSYEKEAVVFNQGDLGLSRQGGAYNVQDSPPTTKNSSAKNG